MPRLVRVDRTHASLPSLTLPAFTSRFSLVPEDARHRPRPEAPGEGESTNASGEHGVGGVISNVFQGLSRFFLGGEERPHGSDEAHPDAQGTADGRNDAAQHNDSTTSRPPGSFPRSVSPTVDQDPDQAIPESSNTATAISGDPARSGSAVSGPADNHPQSSVPFTDGPNNGPSTNPSDNSASRFISSFFDQRSGSPLAHGNARSPGPMGTASYFGRVSSPPAQDRVNNTNTPSQRDLPHSSDRNQPGSSSAATIPSHSPPTVISHTQNQFDNAVEEQPARQPSPHPVYPTLIPAEHRERHARREAMLRQAEGHDEQSTDEAGGTHALPE